MNSRVPSSTLFPYTTLFRSLRLYQKPPLAALPEQFCELEMPLSRAAPKVSCTTSSVSWRQPCHLRNVWPLRSEEHTSELQSPMYLVCRLLLEKKNHKKNTVY